MSMWKSLLLACASCFVLQVSGRADMMERRDGGTVTAGWCALKPGSHRMWSCALIREIWGKSCLEAVSI